MILICESLKCQANPKDIFSIEINQNNYNQLGGAVVTFDLLVPNPFEEIFLSIVLLSIASDSSK